MPTWAERVALEINASSLPPDEAAVLSQRITAILDDVLQEKTKISSSWQNLTCLPHALLLRCLQMNLDQRELCRLQQSCLELRLVAADDSLWCNLCAWRGLVSTGSQKSPVGEWQRTMRLVSPLNLFPRKWEFSTATLLHTAVRNLSRFVEETQRECACICNDPNSRVDFVALDVKFKPRKKASVRHVAAIQTAMEGLEPPPPRSRELDVVSERRFVARGENWVMSHCSMGSIGLHKALCLLPSHSVGRGQTGLQFKIAYIFPDASCEVDLCDDVTVSNTLDRASTRTSQYSNVGVNIARRLHEGGVLVAGSTLKMVVAIWEIKCSAHSAPG